MKITGIVEPIAFNRRRSSMPEIPPRLISSTMQDTLLISPRARNASADPKVSVENFEASSRRLRLFNTLGSSSTIATSFDCIRRTPISAQISARRWPQSRRFGYCSLGKLSTTILPWGPPNDGGYSSNWRLPARRAVRREGFLSRSIISDLLCAHIADIAARRRSARPGVRAPLSTSAAIARTVLRTNAGVARGMVDRRAFADDRIGNVMVGLRGGWPGQQRPKD